MYYFRKVADEMSTKDKISCKRQWLRLIQKFKSFESRSGDGAGDESLNDPTDWQFYEILLEYGANKHSFFPPLTISSSDVVKKKKKQFRQPNNIIS